MPLAVPGERLSGADGSSEPRPAPSTAESSAPSVRSTGFTGPTNALISIPYFRVGHELAGVFRHPPNNFTTTGKNFRVFFSQLCNSVIRGAMCSLSPAGNCLTMPAMCWSLASLVSNWGTT